VRKLSIGRGVLLFGIAAFRVACAAEADPGQAEFFETRVRPIFADHCYSCHSEKAEKLKGGLRLDTQEYLLKGGKSGPAIVPGEADASLLIKAVRYSDPKLKMPPKGKRLTPEQVADLESWVKMGAAVPAPEPASHNLRDAPTARARHWAFQPLRKPPIPVVIDKEWVQSPVDAFILAQLEARHLSPGRKADRRTLIRRVSYDLLGLPPTAQETEAFENDNSPDAYARLVERLLASPHYGERWGRYWLDVARYADTKGYLAGGEERRYAFSYTYRDYVVRAYNEDKPYDQFIIEQLAADELPQGADKGSLAALGFLTLGRRFLNNQNDIIDDRIDVVSRGTLGLTVACARCHDHKFDPIPTRDYYSLHGIFASSHEPAELPLLGELRDSLEYRDFLKQKEKIEGEMSEFKRKEIDKFKNDLRHKAGDYLLGVREAQTIHDKKAFDTFAGEHKLNPVVLQRWQTALEEHGDNERSILGPWVEFANSTNIAGDAPALLAKFDTQPGYNSIVIRGLRAGAPNSLREAANIYTKLFKQADDDWKAAVSKATEEHKPAPKQLEDPASESLRQLLYGDHAPADVPESEAESILAQPIRDGTAPLRNKIEELNWTHPGAPARAMALLDVPQPHNSHVLLRGNPGSPGEEVPRRFLEVLSNTARPVFTNGSGRLELARAIASPENPLTARVYVNRVWMHHFGEGFVKTPGDFGVRTEEPLQHALLDFLAASFVEHGWSTKYLHRLILLSSAYQQASDSSPANLAADPENNLWSHMNRQRLDFESLRDTLLAISGKLDERVGGLPVDLETEPFSARRTIYGLIDRQNLPGMFRTFDFSNPDTSSQRRFSTTVPQQALFLMNSPFVIEQARALAACREIAEAKDHAQLIQALYRRVFQRAPIPSEIQLALQFLQNKTNPSRLTPVEKYAQVLLLSNEVMFVD